MTSTPTLDLSSVPTPEALEAAANATVQRRIDTGRRVAEVLSRLRDAYAEVAAIEAEFEDAYKDATDGAWTAAELAESGIPTPPSAKKTRRGRAATKRTPSTRKRSSKSGSSTPEAEQ
jgi:hypothetical protein